jgi:ketosteroid isomerase-like protein
MNAALSEEQEVLDLEIAALKRWAQGDPDGFLHLSDPEVVYFDPFHAHRLDGIEALRELYESLRGQVRLEKFDLIDPKVTVSGDMALLTFNFRSSGDQVNHWNATEVYRRVDGEWRIIHSHWSITKPELLEPGV